MNRKKLEAIEQIDELAGYLLKHFQHEIKNEGAVEMVIRLLDKFRAQKPEVTEEELKTIATDIVILITEQGHKEESIFRYLKNLFKEAGIEVVKK